LESYNQQVFLYIVAFLKHSVEESSSDYLEEEAERHREEVSQADSLWLKALKMYNTFSARTRSTSCFC